MSFVSSLFDDPLTVHEFADEQFIKYMLDVEVALAKVQSELGVIPYQAADHIAQAASELEVDLPKIYASLEKAGIPTIELISQLRKQVVPDYATYVHWGATSQDIMDTALILQLRAVINGIEKEIDQLTTHLARLADAHRGTLMAARTHSQQALPTTFGLKVAGWLAPIHRQQQRLTELKPRLLVLQFAGAAGTLASLGSDGLRVQEALAAELGLGTTSVAWHTSRDNLVEFAGWLSLLTGSMAKMAQDIILMAQTEIGEVLESNDPSRGGSSTLPQKRNPMISEMIIAAARTNASLLGNMHQTLVQEHERATHSWQMEWITLPQMLSLTMAALKRAVFLGENLVVNIDQMKQNVNASNGLLMAEAISLTLAPLVGWAEAKALAKEAALQVASEGGHLVDVLRTKLDLDVDWDSLKNEATYLGSADALIDRVLSDHQLNEDT